jgi:colanic acid/amylovoran biosynthesis protein
MMMLPQTFNQDSENDYLLFKDIERNRPNADIIVTSDIYSSDIQQQIIRGADAMFGSRYHSVVFAINNNVPFIAFSYEHKIAGLLEELGLRDEMIDIKGLFTSSNFNQSVLDKFDAMVPTIHTAPDAQKIAREKALEAFKEFKKALIKS